jgi:hypothetical protein
LKRCALINSRASGFAAENGSALSIRILISRPDRRSRTGTVVGLIHRRRSWTIKERAEPSRADMDIDLVGADVDAFDEICKQGALAGCGQLRPTLADLRGAHDESTLGRRIGELRRLVNAAGIEEPLPHPAGYKLLDPQGWNAQPGGPVRLSLGDQRAGDIVAIARALCDRVGRRHRIAVAIRHHAGEQVGWRVRTLVFRSVVLPASCA